MSLYGQRKCTLEIQVHTEKGWELYDRLFCTGAYIAYLTVFGDDPNYRAVNPETGDVYVSPSDKLEAIKRGK